MTKKQKDDELKKATAKLMDKIAEKVKEKEEKEE